MTLNYTPPDTPMGQTDKDVAPALTVIPPTLDWPLTPPLTPTCPPQHAGAKEDTETCPTSPPIHRTSLPLSLAPIPIPIDEPHSLHAPLTHHLRLLHPQTPRPIIHFIATRLLSPDIPYGHSGPWTPIDEETCDLSAAGVGLEAGKGCRRKEDSQGQKIDCRIEEMYEVARESFRRLEIASPGVDKL